jgi:hypothetical protein
MPNRLITERVIFVVFLVKINLFDRANHITLFCSRTIFPSQEKEVDSLLAKSTVARTQSERPLA